MNLQFNIIICHLHGLSGLVIGLKVQYDAWKIRPLTQPVSGLDWRPLCYIPCSINKETTKHCHSPWAWANMHLTVVNSQITINIMVLAYPCSVMAQHIIRPINYAYMIHVNVHLNYVQYSHPEFKWKHT